MENKYLLILGLMLLMFTGFFVTSSFITPLVRKIALQLNWVDDPKRASRKIHKNVVPYLGGIAIYLGFLLSVAIYIVFFQNHFSEIALPPWFTVYLFGGGLILAVGTVDDIFDLSPIRKLLAQIAISCLAFIGGIQIDHVIIPFIGLIEFGQFSFPVTVLVLTAAMNAINIIDGMDGLATGVVIIAGIANTLLAIHLKLYFVALMSAILVSCLLGFIRSNWHPARIFLGDGGSLLIGYLIVVLGIQNVGAASNFSGVILPVLALFYPVLDVSFAIARRVLRGKPMMSADRTHIHYFLMNEWLNHKNTVEVILLYSSAICVTGLLFVYEMYYVATFFAIMLLLVLFGFFIITDYFGLNHLYSYLKNRPYLRTANAYKDYIWVKIKYACDEDELWTLLKRVAKEFRLDAISWKDNSGKERIDGVFVCAPEEQKKTDLKSSGGTVVFSLSKSFDEEVNSEIESLVKVVVRGIDKRLLKLKKTNGKKCEK